MPRRLLGTLILVLLLSLLLYTRPAWAGSNGEEARQVLVRVSPLTLLLQNNVTIKVGDFTCERMDGAEPSSICSDLPPGDYEVTATAEGYIVSPPSYPLTIPGEPKVGEHDGDKDSAATAINGEFYFRLYQIRNELFMPSVQIKR